MRYDWYYPGDAYQAGVTAVFTDEELKTFGGLIEAHASGEADDLFDVALYGVGNTEEQYVRSAEYRESRQALENLLQLANVGLRVMQTVPRLLDEEQDYFDRHNVGVDEAEDTYGWLDHNGCLDTWEAEVDHDSSVARIQTLKEVAGLFSVDRPENSEAVTA